MGESLLLITIITLVVLTIRRARPVILETPVAIRRPGQYQITLAPQLNRAQTFIEEIAKNFALLHQSKGDLATQYFEVHDPKVFSKGKNFYLLAISLRAEILYFQAINSKSEQSDPASHCKELREFSEVEMQQYPIFAPRNEGGEEMLCGSVNTVARQLNIVVMLLD